MDIRVGALLLCVAVQATASEADRPPLGAVQGIVLGAQEKPIGHAKVFAEVVSRPRGGPLNYVFTDEQGQFFLGGLAAAEYAIYASKDEEGYRNSSFAFLAIGMPPPPTAKVEPGKVTSGVVVRLGEPGGVLVGKIVEGQTEEPIKTARYKLYLPDKPEIFISGSVNQKGAFQMSTPPVPFQAEVAAPGFLVWHSESAILVPSRSRKELSIVLVREKTRQ